jgi:hypothetical protein
MGSGLKRVMRNVAGGVSLLNGFWAFQLQAGAAEKDWAPIAAASVSAWACYFAITWIIGGLRSER